MDPQVRRMSCSIAAHVYTSLLTPCARHKEKQEKPKSAYELNAEKTFLEHLERLQNAQASGPFMDPPLDLSFMNSKVSKNNSSERHGKVIMRENLQLLKRLALIQAESVEQRLKQQKLRNVGPPMHSVRYNVRMREKDEHARENLRLLRRLQTVESAYKREDFARDRRNFERLMNMRKQDNTRAHLFACHAGVGLHEKFRKMAEAEARREEAGRSRPPRFIPKTLGRDRVILDAPSKLPPLKGTARKNKGRLTVLKKKKPVNEEGRVTDTDNIEMLTLSRGDVTGSNVASNVAMVHCLMEIPNKSFVVAAPEGAKTLNCSIKVWADYPLSNQSTLNYEIVEGGSKQSIAEVKCTVSEGRKLMASLETAMANTTHSPNAKAVDEQELQTMYEVLTQMFKSGDVNGSGHLDRDEFFGLLRDAELGISEPELHMVLSEADEDDDGNINYVEFLPIAIDLVQSFRARREAQREYREQHGEVSEEALKLLYSGHVEDLVKKLDRAFKSADVANLGILSRAEFKTCMKKNAMDLTRVEFNMVLARMPRDAFGKIKYEDFANVLYEVRFTTLKNSIMETRASDTAKLLMKLCQEEEENSMELGDDMESLGSLEPEYSGMITTMQLNKVLTNIKLSLNRLQVTSIMCEAEVDEGMIDYWTFVPIAAKAIDSMNDPNAIQQKADLMAQETISPEDFLKGKKESELRDELMEVFDQYDTDKSGELDTAEFEVCLQALDLGITKGQISALMAVADTDNTGYIDRDEFMEFGFQHLIHLQKERHVRAIQQSLELEESENKISDEEMFHAYFDPDSDEHTETMKAIERDLQRMFTKADKEGLGFLNPMAFRDVMTAMDLGMSPYQIAVLMTEADKNGDGIIQYSEFVPVGLRMLYSYKAKAAALRKYKAREKQAYEKSLSLMHAQQGQLDSCVHELELLFQSKDFSGGLVVLDKNVVEECLRDPRGGLTRQEINLILARMPREGNKFNCKSIRTVMAAVRHESVQRTVLLQMPSSTLEKHLLQLFSQETIKTRDLDEGVLAVREIFDVMLDAKYLNLTRQQLMAVMSLTNHCYYHHDHVVSLEPDGGPTTPKSLSRQAPPSNVSASGPINTSADKDVIDIEFDVDYSKFAACASEMISKFFDVTEIERRAKLLSGAKMSHVNIFGGLTKPELDKRLLSEFRDRDKRRTGIVSAALFQGAMQSVKQLRLTDDDCVELFRMAPRDEDGNVIWRQWITVACESIMDFAESKETRPSELTTSQRGPGGKNMNGISESMVSTVAEKVVNLLQLHSRPDEDENGGDMYGASFKDPFDSKNFEEAAIPTEPVSPSVRGIRRQLSRRASSEGPSSPTRISSAADMGNGGLEVEELPPLTYSTALYRTVKKVYILNVDGARIAHDLQPVPTSNRVMNMALHHVVIEVKRSGEDQMGDTASVIVLNVTLNERYVLTKAMPSLAKVDGDLAASWAKTIASKISVVQDYKGRRSLSFRKGAERKLG